ncbi:ATP-dependent Clp protease ATP-binding subunit [Streptococcus agalactiae]|uniref:ATP-dependent Clp protease ATP-binding subunit ClpA n=2 Tax=Streptococcus agalactiae TaxID=1311 RepID=A0AB74H478_STRAG|nr:ATP-dependent Clp protease ATP-binding subunit [Streptococcus agalactiae]EPX12626.1 ATP-dependent Clp protease ATP-binding protein [Streptococcus agalactiae LDS 610]EGS26799.1 ATP-dependent Clp protease, ATP-binding subunit ClpC [Streptococcus agalactiae FSL S3-026]EPV86581.1 ATP-dependent Clp protease ATP-binding protein [Streptococcus agalactiae FSL S3-586]KLL31757.1 Clp protease ClpX [Streptococcus agalactiae]MBE3600791.1 ATP-dependent Clp protease ATP-binding subunit [Streptococcus agal
MSHYSIKLQEVFRLAQFQAARYESHYLESWHLLLAMVLVHDSVAGLTFAEYESEVAIEEYEAATILALGRAPKEEITDYQFLEQSSALKKILKLAENISIVVGAEDVGTEHVLLAMLVNKDLLATRILELVGFRGQDDGESVRMVDLRKALERHAGFTKDDIKAIYELRNPKKAKSGASFSDMMKPPSTAGDLADFTRDLSQMAVDGEIEPVIGRDKEISRMVQVLSRKTKNNPVLVGDAGVGKTALAYGLAQRIANGNIPYELRDMRVLELDMMSVVAGTRFRGDFEERMNQIIADIEEDGHIILFIDELHTIMGSGSGIDSTLDAANILKPALARGTLRTVGATTQEEYQKHIEKDAALSRRFAKVLVEEPNLEDAYEILLGLKPAYEAFHNVTISDEAVMTAVKVAHRYLTSKNLPDSAIDLLDEASATVQMMIKKNAPSLLTEVDQAILDDDMKSASKALKASYKGKKRKPIAVTEDHIMATLSRLSGIPVEKLTQADSKKYLNLEKELHKRVIGQDDAVTAISRAIRRNQSGIRTGKRPIGSFMFLGPTGVGKTELAKALAEVLFDDESALIRFDMSEYMEKFAASRLNGAPPGYVGYDEGGELTEKVRNKPYSVLLFDEVEKAHPDIFNVLLQVLDDGVLTDSRGRKVDFSNTIIIMTSNLGATALRDDKTVGFGAKDISHDYTAMQKRIMEELKKAYRPEFINRIDEKVVFHSLSQDNMREVVKIMVKPLILALKDKGMDLKFQPSALKHLAEDGYDIEMGARPLRRTIQTQVEDHLSELLLANQVKEGQVIKIGVSKGKLKFDIAKS